MCPHSPLNPHHSPRYKTGCWIKHLLLYGATKPLMNQFHGVDHILSWMAGNHVTSRIWWYLSHIACILAGEAFSIAVSFVKKVALLVQILCHCPWFFSCKQQGRMDCAWTVWKPQIASWYRRSWWVGCVWNCGIPIHYIPYNRKNPRFT